MPAPRHRPALISTAALAVAVGSGIYEARQASTLRTQLLAWGWRCRPCPGSGAPPIAIDIPRQLFESLPVRRSLAIIVSSIVLLTIVIAVWWGLSHKVSFTFVRYVQSATDKTWTAELRLENNVGWPIQYQNTATYKRHVPGCVYREKLTNGWSAAQQDPWPNAEASAQYFALFPGKNATITIPLVPGTPPRIVGIQYNLCDSPKGAFTRHIETLVSRVKRLLNINNDSSPEVWCPEALTAPSTPSAPRQERVKE